MSVHFNSCFFYFYNMISFPNAKINLGLYITEKRSDGFHNLETVFLPVGWSDILEFAKSDKLVFTSSGISIDSAPESNLVMKAYQLLKREFNIPPLKVHLHKQIPFGAGLGGGSSDAAFTLRMLNREFDLKLDNQKLCEYAAELGSDCPFFFINQPVYATGRGEIMTPVNLSLNNLFMLLVKPPVEVATSNAFRFVVPQKTEVFLPDLLELPVEQWQGKIMNQFESSVFQQYPVIGEVKSRLYDLGAIYASMSGSGSCVFGFFREIPVGWQHLFPSDYLTFGQQF